MFALTGAASYSIVTLSTVVKPVRLTTFGVAVLRGPALSVATWKGPRKPVILAKKPVALPAVKVTCTGGQCGK